MRVQVCGGGGGGPVCSHLFPTEEKVLTQGPVRKGETPEST